MNINMENSREFSPKEAEMLFQIARDINAIKAWKWLGDTDVFGIKFRDMKDIIFCSTWGMGGELFGEAFYFGKKGIGSYFKLLNEDYDVEEEAINTQEAITLNFEDRKDISKEEYELIKLSGINFRGKKEWPVFIKYEPGFVPWGLTPYELRLMIKILKALKEALPYIIENPKKAELMREGKCCILNIDLDGSMKESILDYNAYFDEPLTLEIPIIYDELEIKRITKGIIKTNEVWEMDTFYHVMPVKEETDDRAYFPLIFLIANKLNGMILGNNVIKSQYDVQDFQEYLMNYVKENKILPKKIEISNQMLYMYLHDLISKMGVNVELKEKLSTMIDVKRDFYDSLT